MSQYCPGYCPSPFPILPVSILLASMLATLQHDKFLYPYPTTAGMHHESTM